MRLRAGLSVLWRREGESQVGVDPRCSITLQGLTPAEQRLLDRLDTGRDPTEAQLVRLGSSVGVPARRVRELLRTLGEAGVLETADRPTGHGASPEEAYWSRLLPDGDGAGVLRRRAEAVITVAGLDHVGLRLAAQLAEAGVGTLMLEELEPGARVTTADLGPYAAEDVGRPRGERAVARLRATFSGVRTGPPPGTRPDLVALVSWGVADPMRTRALLRRDVRHLPVVLGEVDAVLGPLVTPGEGPCTRCLELQRTEADPAWPAVATQLRCAPHDPVPGPLGQLAATLAAHQLLAAIDGREVEVAGATLQTGALSPIPTRHRWRSHPSCGCGGLAGTTAPETAKPAVRRMPA